MKADLQKIRVTGLRKHYKLLMQELHRAGVMEITHNDKLTAASAGHYDDHYGVFDLARIQFAIDFLKPYAPTKSKIESMLSGGKLVMSEEDAKARLKEFSGSSETIISQCEELEGHIVRLENEIHKIPEQQKFLDTLSDFSAELQPEYDTEQTKTWVGKVTPDQVKAFERSLSELSNLVDVDQIGREKLAHYYRVTVLRKIESDAREVLNEYGFEKMDLTNGFKDFIGQPIHEVKKSLARRLTEHQADLETSKEKVKELSVHVEDLKILFDFNSWRKRKNDLQHDIFQSDHVFAFEAWGVNKAMPDLKKWVKNAFVGEVSIDEIEPQEGEEAPTYLKNKWGVRFYEPLVEMYGLPKATEFDPTPFVSFFFFIFFGLCLSDVGYGAILTFVSTYFLLFGKFNRAARDGLLLILFCGISAMIGGVILGGYFGMTPEQFPLLADPSREGFFYGQLLNPMSGSGPILFLTVSLALGFVQILFGLGVDFFQRWKNGDIVGALGDPASWAFFLVSLTLWGLADLIGLDKKLMGNLSIVGAVLLMITQSRNQKNWLLKPIFGILGLYNITSYLSDLLSYSRIMALGLATGVVGFAMNMTAGILGDMMPHWILSLIIGVIVIIFGHTLNFGLSLLGAFIHSGRLQFIEFFGKFYEGGGVKFKPFKREEKYLYLDS